ncbi:MAG TPA: class I SAM-dependent methyltransferase [Thermoanaerobaculia bacterium]|nr:class I SAM-dependent methyltransferase [Thermoanaerobaculia bacterium]
MRRLAKAVVPVRWRLFLRRTAGQAPGRWKDLPQDAANLLFPTAFGGPIPPPGLRARVGGVSRAEFATVGRGGAQDLLRAFTRSRDPGRAYPDWLDFGCGCGRVARWMGGAPPVVRLAGVDVDAAQVRWASRHLAGRYSLMQPAPPLPFGAESFDVVYAVSIFTHLDEHAQFEWLAELARVLRPGGLLIATTHGPELSRGCPGLTAADLGALEERGFLAVDPGGTFNERSSFHSAGYLEERWGRTLTRRFFEPRGFVSYQDLSAWEKPAGARRS